MNRVEGKKNPRCSQEGDCEEQAAQIEEEAHIEGSRRDGREQRGTRQKPCIRSGGTPWVLPHPMRPVDRFDRRGVRSLYFGQVKPESRLPRWCWW